VPKRTLTKSSPARHIAGVKGLLESREIEGQVKMTVIILSNIRGETSEKFRKYYFWKVDASGS